jgi:hypothetical protein
VAAPRNRRLRDKLFFGLDMTFNAQVESTREGRHKSTGAFKSLESVGWKTPTEAGSSILKRWLTVGSARDKTLW